MARNRPAACLSRHTLRVRQYADGCRTLLLWVCSNSDADADADTDADSDSDSDADADANSDANPSSEPR